MKSWTFISTVLLLLVFMIADILEMFDLDKGGFDLHDILTLGSLGLLLVLGFYLYRQWQGVIESTRTHHADLQEVQEIANMGIWTYDL